MRSGRSEIINEAVKRDAKVNMGFRVDVTLDQALEEKDRV